MPIARTFPLGLTPPWLIGRARRGEPASASGKRPTEPRKRRPLRNLVAPSISGTTTVGEVLGASLGSWSGELPISYAYQWLRDDAEIPGATSDAYLIAVGDYGSRFRVRVTATNALGSVVALSEESAEVDAVLPSNVTPPVVTGTPTQNETLSCSTGSWSGTTPLSYTFQWRRDGSPILSATLISYTLQASDVGALVDCVVTAQNVAGTASQDSNNLGPIVSSGGVAPTITVAPVLSWTGGIGSSPVLTDPVYTGDPGTITWTYYRDGVADGTIAGVSKATAEAYVAAWSGLATGVNDVAVERVFRATVTNSAGSDSADSNPQRFDDTVFIGAGGTTEDDLVLADSDTTVDSWGSSFGSVSATISAPASSNRLAYSATGGVGGRPLASALSGDWLYGTMTRGSTWTAMEIGVVADISYTSNNLTVIANTVFEDATALGNNIRLDIFDSTTLRAAEKGGSPVASDTAGFTGSYQHWSADSSDVDNVIRIRKAGTISATGSGTVDAYADGSTLILGARTYLGGNSSVFDVMAWYCFDQLTAAQRLDLRALLTGRTGVAC